ncbi:UNVERIFIED_CONTAM: DEIH-box ATPase [Siphonaria sp. JEL0065]|nr:DEIH-box ATPase [Siphonaria sp. JEL0065]
MAEQTHQKNQYGYSANSNLVINQDRSALPRRDAEPSGEPETLFGKINPKDFGVRVASSASRKDKDKEDKEKDKKRQRDKAVDKQPNQGKQKKQKFGYNNILSATADFDADSYRPKTKETAQVYERILALIHTQMGGAIPPEVLNGAAYDILVTLKDDSLKDVDRKRDVEDVLASKVSSEWFAQLVTLAKKVNDFVVGGGGSNDLNGGDADLTRDQQQGLDDEYGVAVVFDEDEDDEEGSGNEYEVKDQDSDDDDQDDYNDAGTQQDPNNPDQENSDNDDENEYTTTLNAKKVTSSSKKEKDTSSSLSINPHDIDAFWLQRQIASAYPNDPHIAQEKAKTALSLLSSSSKTMRDIENDLMELFDYDNFDLVKIFIKNKDVIVWCTLLVRAATADERHAVEERMRDEGHASILDVLALAPTRKLEGKSRRGVVEGAMEIDGRGGDGDSEDVPSKSARAAAEASAIKAATNTGKVPKNMIDLEEMQFLQGGHLTAPKTKGMEPGEKLIEITSLPKWAHQGFKNSKSLNRIQSRVYPIAFGEDENMLLCAPTGAGKTNCAMLTILREIGKHIDESTGLVDLDAFKIVYIAPMKALVAEMVGNFGNRLSGYNIKVAELTGDRQLTKAQIAETQIIVTTPEKWDVITRKATDRSYTNLVRLIIIDEIHLLHDERGPVLESLVIRTLRMIEQTQNPVRLVGLSATLPNYIDVATLLRVDPKIGLFFFDNSFRPCPLQQQYIGITEKKAIKRFQLMNEITYSKIMEDAGKNQVLVFCHSRKETAKTAKAIRDMCIERDTIGQILKTDAASREILQTEVAGVKDKDLADVLTYGFGIHHAGMSHADRTLVEDLFSDGHIQVLVSTATLAWGVNLPAHTVIIKGTQVYSPEKGSWVELSPQDVLQMLGRAGRPQFDTHGEGIIITTHTELQYYLSLLNVQLPIESQFVSRLADNLNAEIVLGSIRNREDAVQWLGYSYLYIRMLRNGPLYGVTPEELEEDPNLEQKRIDLIHSAASVLDKCNLIKYDRKTGKFQVTELGRIASHYYITHGSMATYNQHLKPSMGLIDLFRTFALSSEFKYIPVREEEKMELAKIMERVPIPVKESIEEPTSKINVLLQSYISQLKLEGFALMADMVYVTQSAGRILRAIFEICLKRGWAQLSRKALDLCKMVEKRMWLSMNPIRQFKGVPMGMIPKLERKEFSWDRYYDLNPQQLGELAGMPKFGKLIHKLVHQFPKLELQASVQPITRSLLRIELTITPDFVYDDKVSGPSEMFWILVEDVDSEIVLYHDSFVLKQRYSEEEHNVTFTVPLFEPLPPNYFISLVSDRWLHSETRMPVSFKHLILPEKYPPHTELLDLQPLPVTALRSKEYERLYADIKHFNPIQTQVFNAMYTTDDNVFIGAPTGSGKTVCAEFALLRLWALQSKARCVYIAPFDDVVEDKLADWKAKFSGLMGGKNIVALTGDTAADLKLLEKGDIIFSTPANWDMISRRWKQRKNVQTVGLFILDEAHLIGGDIGPTMEIITSRMRFVGVQTENKIRIVALSTSLANARDVGEWIGATAHSVFNFPPTVRPVPLELHIQGYNVPHFASMMIAMTKPTYLAITQMAGTKPAIVFVPSRRQCRLTAADLMVHCASDDEEKRFLHCSEEELAPFLNDVEDKQLAEALQYGVAYFHEALSKSDKRTVKKLFRSGAIQVVVASRETCWSIPMKANLVVVMGTQHFVGKEHRYSEYVITDVLQMMGRASRPLTGEVGRCVIMCQSVKRDFYKKFLFEALPVESHLDHYLHDHFNAEIGTHTIENKQDAVDYLTWTFLYRRMTLNPNYYNLQGTTHRHLSDHLSDLVETTLDELAQSKCILVEDDEVSPLNLGMIAAYYYINYVTIELFAMSLKEKTKMRGLLEIISAAAEFEDIPIRHHEDTILRRLYDRIPIKFDLGGATGNKINNKLMDPHVKTNILLQAHFSRLSLPPDLESDQKLVLSKVLRLIQASVDVISTNGWLGPGITAMELSQMCVQAVWDKDSWLRQVPRITLDMIAKLKKVEVTSVTELLEMEDDDRNAALQGLTKRDMAEVATFANRYPNVELAFEVMNVENSGEEGVKRVKKGESVVVNVRLDRVSDEDEDEEDEDEMDVDGGKGKGKAAAKPLVDVGPVLAPFFPGKKDEGWWVVIGQKSSNALLAIKRTTLQQMAALKLEFAAPPPPEGGGKVELKVYLMCDAYTGVDQEYEITLLVDDVEEESDDEMEEAEAED